MMIKQKIILAALVLAAGLGLGAAPAAYAQNPTECAGVKTAIIGGDICKGADNTTKKTQDNAIWKLLIFVLNVMTAGVGILAVGGIVYGSILYTSAGDKAEQTKKAISIITNVVIGIIAYGVMYLVLNFLIPGGIFA